MSTNGKATEAQELQPSQRNKHCIIETPEGHQVGIVKYNAITSVLSIKRNPIQILKFLEKEGNKYSKENFNILVLINGFPHSLDSLYTLYVREDFYLKIVKEKRLQNIPFDTEIYYNNKTIEIFTDQSRPMTPYLIVNKDTRRLMIDEKNAWKKDHDWLLKNECIEYLSAREEDYENIVIASSVETFYKNTSSIFEAESKILRDINKKRFDYSHSSIDPLQMFSLCSSTCIFADKQMVPRTIFQTVMMKQALTYYNINYHLRFDKTMKILYKADRALTETDTYPSIMLDILPAGQTANIAFLADEDNQEDAVVVSEDYINSGKFNYIKFKTFVREIPTNKKGIKIKLGRPPLKDNESFEIYRNIGEDGLPIIDSYIKNFDCILGQIGEIDDGKIENQSSYADDELEGYVDKVSITRDKGNPIVRIKLREFKKYKAGDKLALRYAQKGTIGRVASRDELPRVSNGPNKGIVPDVLFNPHGFPSRQTTGLLIEGLLNKAALYDGIIKDATPFRNKIEDIKYARNVLKNNNLDEYGYEEMEMADGKKLNKKVFFVPIFEQILRHQVDDKFVYRNEGRHDVTTHQPVSGRSRKGGLKIGEMEKDAFGAHGGSYIIKERMMISSDAFKISVCNNCGVIINNKICNVCNDSDPVLITIPYVFKSLIRYLAGVGIDVRLKTEKLKQ